MPAEKIIQQINKDAEFEIKKIIKDAKQQAKHIIENAKKEAEAESVNIRRDGEKQSENNKKIQIAKAKQEIKHEIMNTKEKIIEESFVQAYSQISKINEEHYKKIVTKLMENSRIKIGEDCKILVSRDIDKTIAKNLRLDVIGRVDALGGFVATSCDERIKLNNTFEGIIDRNKDKLRVKVGKILFS
jgi:vacuolar-type H+-ATPase subunit E/Vma4